MHACSGLAQSIQSIISGRASLLQGTRLLCLSTRIYMQQCNRQHTVILGSTQVGAMLLWADACVCAERSRVVCHVYLQEDADLFSINYLHFGAPKVWYCVSPSNRAKFERMCQVRLLSHTIHPHTYSPCITGHVISGPCLFMQLLQQHVPCHVVSQALKPSTSVKDRQKTCQPDATF